MLIEEEEHDDVAAPRSGLTCPRRWENPQTRRYYEVRPLKNLFGEWEVFCVWGGIGTRRGGARAIPADSLADALDISAAIAARRRQRHYFEVIT
jgi:WGR domain